ncbi:AhpC/TSA family protein [Chitinophaga silvatica]|uniref:AhpC/TSA family protein n=1 Tax=Chitinophaga silvatica TaxID=2282649 RepID=A0A3E1YHZ5_9BACT|nr:TlpA disulfide reductase family protein [Chitinophaga silvatica]RFS26978.1 AhpC/TSA family protein [Chitinophaga silvatica]
MKRIILISLLSWPYFSFSQGNKYVINGRMDKIDVPTKIYLTTVIDDVMTMDSTTITDHQFHFEGTVEGPIKASLFINNIQPNDKAPITIQYKNNIRIFVLEPCEIKVSGKDLLKNASVSSKINDQEKSYRALLKDATKTMDKMELQIATMRAEKKNDPEKEQELYVRYQLSLNARKMLQQKYISEHKKSFYSLFALEEIAGYTYDPVSVSAIFETLDPSVKNTLEARLFKEELDRGMNLLIGAKAPDFEVKELKSGKIVKLSDFIGKYILLDFWATYNNYSRSAHQVMAETYKQYADSNFTIISITVDPPAEKNAILEAINKDQMVWTNLGDPSHQRNDAAKTYNILTLPQVYLIDNNGNIFNKNFPIDSLKTELTKMRYPKPETAETTSESSN